MIETERLYLREMNMDDFDALYKVLADHDIMKHYPYTFDEARVREWIERNMKRYENDGFGLWAVCLKTTGEMIGDCGLTLQNIDGTMLPEIGYHIRADQQRRGYAKEAAAAPAPSLCRRRWCGGWVPPLPQDRRLLPPFGRFPVLPAAAPWRASSDDTSPGHWK